MVALLDSGVEGAKSEVSWRGGAWRRWDFAALSEQPKRLLEQKRKDGRHLKVMLENR
jgi:hypothetical protein